jgi:hypothetical protein
MRLLRHLFLRLLPLAILAGGGFLLFTSAGIVQDSRFESINTKSGPASAYTSGNFDSLLSTQSAAKTQYVRETLDWSQIETTEGTYNWASPTPYASLFASEKAAGLKVVAVLSGGPTYLTGSNGDVIDAAAFLLRWANFVQSAVDTLGTQVDVWEIGEQINTSTGMSAYITPAVPSSSTTPDPALYAKMLIVANKIIKAADPNEEVWMGSLVSASAGSCAMNPLTFLLEVNGASGFSSIDSIVYTPMRGAISPETALTSTNSTCVSSLPAAETTLSGEVQAVQDLARQLGGKTLYIEGLGWTADELTTLAANRAISSDQVLADELTRATVQLAANNGINTFFWKIDPGENSTVFTTLTNLNSVLEGASFQSQPQGQSGSVYEYRFTKGSQWIIIAWRAQDGDSPIPVTLSNLSVSSLTAYSVDAAGFVSANGTPIQVDASGSTTLYLNERPVVFIGKTSDLAQALQQDGAAQTAQLKYEAKLASHRMVNEAKAAILHALKEMLTSAEDKAVNWGKDKLNSLLN